MGHSRPVGQTNFTAPRGAGTTSGHRRRPDRLILYGAIGTSPTSTSWA